MDLDEVAHDEPPHQDLPCLQIQLHVFSSLVVKEFKDGYLTFFANTADTQHTAPEEQSDLGLHRLHTIVCPNI